MGTDNILEPRKAYDGGLKTQFIENAKQSFDELVNKSGIDAEANRKTVKDYYLHVQKRNKMRGKLAGIRTLQVFMIIFTILFFLGSGGTIYWTTQAKDLVLPIILTVSFIALAVVFIILLCTVVKKTIKKRKEKVNILENKVQELLNIAKSQMEPLNALFDWYHNAEITQKTTPLIELDPYFDIKKLDYLCGKFGYVENKDDDVSTVGVVSGSIVGNPFLVLRQFNHYTFQKTYTGSLTITWTETAVDSKGNRYTVPRTQVLRAQSEHPAPGYNYNTFLVYGNEAAPDLIFSRVPSGASGLNEGQVKRKVNREEKEYARLAQKALSDNNPNTNFTQMSNKEFEVLFGAKNRNNEVQFRLLFTPLAQKNILELIHNPKPFGDDFSFVKEKKLNFIKSNHAQNTPIILAPADFFSFSVDESCKMFVEKNTQVFESLYFDLAPLISIPLYQHTKTHEYIYKDVYNANFTSYEDEIMANNLDKSLFAHPKTITDVILKAQLQTKLRDSDVVEITAHSFSGIDRVDYINVLGGDGHLHAVPVPWIEYIPERKKTNMVISTVKKPRFDINRYLSSEHGNNFFNSNSKGACFQRGLLAFVPRGTFSSTNEDEIKKIFNVSSGK